MFRFWLIEAKVNVEAKVEARPFHWRQTQAIDRIDTEFGGFSVIKEGEVDLMHTLTECHVTCL